MNPFKSVIYYMWFLAVIIIFAFSLYQVARFGFVSKALISFICGVLGIIFLKQYKNKN
jgi:hypothetical protein